MQYLVLPFKLRPHLSELRVGARSGQDVVHDVDMNVIENNTITITRSTRYVINYDGKMVS
jgi:hypothetical protein